MERIVDWRSLRGAPTPRVVRELNARGEDGSGILWSDAPGDACELSALGAIAWGGHERKPAGSRYEWVGFNLLCNAAPTPFVLDGERFHSIDSFYAALKLPEGTPERTSCAAAPLLE